jgi:hypothetical protein
VIKLPDARACGSAFRRDGFVVVRGFVSSVDAGAIAAEAGRVARQAAVQIDHRSGQDGLAYRVVSGERIQAHARSLFDLYASSELLEWVRSVTQCAVVTTSPHLLSAININCLTQPGDQYPLHRDAVPYTALLFLSDVDEEAGGAFVIESLCGERVRVQPSVGTFMLMDGARCAHGVEPLRRPTLRLTMPMVFPAIHVDRPEGLDEYLYGA